MAGRESFAVQPGDVVAATGGDMMSVNAGTQGGGQGFGLDLAPGVAKTQGGSDFGAILKFGEKVLGPEVKKEQERQFMQGMYRVSAGEAVADIEKNESHWTDIYGGNFVVEGAKVGDAQSRATILAAEAEGKMADLATQDPAAMQEWYTTRMRELSTGEGDDLFLGMAMKEGPGVFKQHAKLHYRHKQEVADANDRTQVGAELGRLEATLRTYAEDPARYSPEDIQEAKWRAFESMIPNVGQNPLAKQKNVVAAITALATQGNFLAIKAIKDGLGEDVDGKQAKLFDSLDPAIKDNLDTALRTQGARWNWQAASPATMKKVQEFYSNGHIYDAVEAKGIIDKINADHTAETGIEVPLLGSQEAIREALQNQATLGRQQAKEAEARAKADATEAKINEAKTLLRLPGGMGTLFQAIKRGAMKDDEFQAAEQQTWEEMQKADDGTGAITNQLKYVTTHPGYKLPSVETFLKTTFAPGLARPTKGTIQAFTLLQGFTQQQRELYLDSAGIAMYDAFQANSVNSKDAVDTIWAKAQESVRQAAELTPEDRKARMKVAEDAFSRLASPPWYAFGEEGLQGYGQGLVKAEGRRMVQYYPYSGEGLKDKLVSNLRHSSQYTLIGPNVVANQVPGQASMEQVLNPNKRADGTRDVKYTQDQLDVAFHLRLNEMAKKFKGSPDAVSLVRMADVNGDIRFSVDIPGQDRAQFITGKDLIKTIEDGKVRQWQKYAQKQKAELEDTPPLGLASDR